MAREDYAAQEARRESLFQRLQFLLTAVTLLIAANLSLMAQVPPDWRWWVLATPSSVVWGMLLWLFRLVWSMYHGHDSLEPKTIKAYDDWGSKRQKELESLGYPESEEIAVQEMQQLLIEDYADAADSNRRVNIEVQAIMVGSQRLVLWLTLTEAIHAVLFVLFVTFGT